MAQLPYLEYPHVAKIGFYKKIENRDGKLKKEAFNEDKIRSPFFFLLEVKDIENSGELAVKFYDKDGKRAARKVFAFGEEGQYYEYILFFDYVENLPAGTYHMTIFLNGKLIYEDHIEVNENPLKT
ncbi:hypothetical protein ACFLRB_03200 [Acidobacteriota bacterium]